ncbi:hypothetical protein IHE45_16G012200 [Dioscorea alata]|uniref:Uncharacterized protein n=1 Tax=Dioscorea alata TaxID=55571 RepID=A0ACB7UFU9_DIOAL|nr:hypothetical protein IHE45_16G012200 [Dioscorea alata]
MARDGEPPPVILVISSDEEEYERRCYVKREGEKRTRRERWRKFSGVEVKTAEEKLGDDDDCCIIGCNLSYALMKMNPLHDEEDEDVSIVFERGQVACRDFPHSRHLCVKYPFSKTSHESYCKQKHRSFCCQPALKTDNLGECNFAVLAVMQCYCYVCDAMAPCKYWTGLLGHCHATDTGSRWQNMRKARRSASAPNGASRPKLSW